MKIIQHGDLNRLKKIKRFTCGECGCIFEDDNTEYKHNFSQRDNYGWYTAHCPECHRTVTLSDEAGSEEKGVLQRSERLIVRAGQPADY